MKYTKTHCIKWRKLFQLWIHHQPEACMCTETLAGQQHRRGVEWVVKGWRAWILGRTPLSELEGVCFKWGRLQTWCWVWVSKIMIMVISPPPPLYWLQSTYSSNADIDGGSAKNSNSGGGSLGTMGSATCTAGLLLLVCVGVIWRQKTQEWIWCQ